MVDADAFDNIVYSDKFDRYVVPFVDVFDDVFIDDTAYSALLLLHSLSELYEDVLDETRDPVVAEFTTIMYTMFKLAHYDSNETIEQNLDMVSDDNLHEAIEPFIDIMFTIRPFLYATFIEPVDEEYRQSILYTYTQMHPHSSGVRAREQNTMSRHRNVINSYLELYYSEPYNYGMENLRVDTSIDLKDEVDVKRALTVYKMVGWMYTHLGHALREREPLPILKLLAEQIVDSITDVEEESLTPP